MRKVSWPLWCAHSAAEKPARQLTRNESLPLLLLLAEWPCAGADDDLVTLAAVVRAAAVVAEGGGAGNAEAVLLAAGGEVLREEPLDPPAAGLRACVESKHICAADESRQRPAEVVVEQTSEIVQRNHAGRRITHPVVRHC